MHSIEQVNVRSLRYDMLKVASFNILLLFTITWLLRNPPEAVLGALIFAVEPTIVLSSRLPISDNMLTTWALLSLLLLILYLRTKKSLTLLATVIIASSSILLKSTGIFVPLSVIFLLLSQKEIRPAAIKLLSLAIVLAGWLLYGYYYDWPLFIKIFQVASGRELFQPGMVMSLLTSFRIGEKPIDFDPQLTWAWISVVTFSLLNHKTFKDNLSKLALPIFIGSYLILFSIMSGHIKGWYRFPFYPFLSWASASFFLYILRDPSLLTSLFFISIPVSSAYIMSIHGYRWTN